ncbi:dCTP deaminase [Candidatus Micrarchaeota archaeon]|nr:dCTP deaminase [Candidatus Micrarchaeota archaeon]
MSLLSDSDILEAIEKQSLKILPFRREHLGPDSIDICLGREILVCNKINRQIDSRKKDVECFEKVAINNEPFVLKTHQFILANTEEKISLSNEIAATIEGRSSIGRLGILVHMTAGIIHAGFGSKEPSTLTLEIYSVNPNDLLLHAGMKIAQLSFFKLNRKATTGYDFIESSKYIAQKSPEPPKVYLDK